MATLSKVEAKTSTWPSPISASMVATQGLRLGAVMLDGDDIYWLEGRPHEGGRTVLVRRRLRARLLRVHGLRRQRLQLLWRREVDLSLNRATRLIEQSLGSFPLLSMRTSFELGPAGDATGVHLFTGVLAVGDG